MKKNIKIRVTSFLLACVMTGNVLVLTGCKKGNGDSKKPSTSISDLNNRKIDDFNDSVEYDYPLLDGIDNMYDYLLEDQNTWNYACHKLEDRYKFFDGWFDLEFDGIDYSDYHNYRLGLFHGTDNNYALNQYIRIVSIDGNFADDYEYSDATMVNSSTSILNRYDSSVELQKQKSTILNHETGEVKYSNNALKPANGFISVKAESDGYYHLLYPNGSLATSNIYNNIIADEETGLIYLVGFTETEVLNSKTGEAKQFDCIVDDVFNGCVIYHVNSVSDENGIKEYGIVYIDDLETDIKSRFIKPLKNLSFAHTNKDENITFIGEDEDGIQSIYSDSGKKISDDYNLIITDKKNTGYNIVADVYDEENTIYYQGVITNKGKEVIPLQEYSIYEIVGKYASFKKGSRYGVMKLDGSIIITPIYNECINCGDHFETIRKLEGGQFERTIFDDELNIIDEGTYSATEAKEIYDKYMNNDIIYLKNR